MVQKYSFEKIKDYLYPEHPTIIKGNFWAMILMVNIIGLPTVLVENPSIIIKAMIIPIMLINICHVVIRLNVEKYQVLYTLFQGIYSLIFSILCIMAGYRFFILYYQEYGLLYIFLTITLQIIFLMICFTYHRNALKEGRYSSKYKKKKKSKVNIFLTAIIVSAGGGGLVIGKILVSKFKDNQSLIVLGLAIILVLMGYIFSLGSNCIHKYYLMKQYRPELFRR
jgi:hypothetical protein